MEKITIVVMFLGVLIFFSHLFNKLFYKIKVPNVLILLIIGILMGFFVDGKVFFGEVGQVFTTVTLIIILFESGVGLKLQELKTSILSATLITVINFIATAGIIIGVTMWLCNFDFTTALFLGSILGGTTAAVVIPMVQQLKAGQKARTVLLLESAFSSVLCLVVGLAALESMRAGNIEASEVFGKIGSSFFFAILIGLLGGFVWSILLNKIRGLKNSMFTTLAFVFIIYGSAELLGLNGGIAALAFGIILGNTEYFDKINKIKRLKFEPVKLNENETNFFSEIVFVLQTYFFVYVGIMIEFGSLLVYLLAILIICMIILVRTPVTRLLIKKDCTPDDRLIMSIMIPKGLIPAILGSIPLHEGLAFGQEIAEIAYAVVLVSITFCSILVIVISAGQKKSHLEVSSEKENLISESQETESQTITDNSNEGTTNI